MTSMRTPIRFLSGEIVDELEADDFDAIVQAEKPVTWRVPDFALERPIGKPIPP